MMTILDDWMRANGLTNLALARRLRGRLSRSTVSRIRRGCVWPREESARLLAKATGIPLAQLMGGDEG
jgi:transcriptional regulator with XRE-family HTH domain